MATILGEETSKVQELISAERAPAGVGRWVGHCAENQKDTSWAPGQGTRLSCQPGSRLGVCERQPSMFFSQ